MKTFEFTVVASCADGDIATLSERLFDAGCDDATVSLQKGVAIIEFDRESKNFYHALSSALSNIKEAGSDVLHIEPDHLVSLSDIAARTGITRAAVSNYARGTRERGFPAPTARVTTDTPLWDWIDVSRWIFRHLGRLSLAAIVEARVVRRENGKLRKQRDHVRAA
jgi:hypothetical protein